MPKVVFKLLWETISQGKNINVVVKNLAKDGRYYWIFTEFETRRDTVHWQHLHKQRKLNQRK